MFEVASVSRVHLSLKCRQQPLPPLPHLTSLQIFIVMPGKAYDRFFVPTPSRISLPTPPIRRTTHLTQTRAHLTRTPCSNAVQSEYAAPNKMIMFSMPLLDVCICSGGERPPSRRRSRLSPDASSLRHCTLTPRWMPSWRRKATTVSYLFH